MYTSLLLQQGKQAVASSARRIGGLYLYMIKHCAQKNII